MPPAFPLLRCFAATVAVSLLMLVGCSSIPRDFDRNPSSALENPGRTTAGQIFRPELKAHSGQSGFILLPSGEEMFGAINGIAAIAEETIDAQYYTWKADTSGKLLIDRLIRAGDRGVRVRILLDDFFTRGQDQGIATIDSHSNIEIRIFNPFSNRTFRGIDFLTDFSRVNHRMHNKVFIADNAVAVVGGRNIGNRYFGVDPDANYRDLDVLAVGPVVANVSHSFDTFWNSDLAIPISAITDFGVSEEERQRSFQTLREWSVEEADGFPYEVFRERDQRIARLDGIRDRFIWANAEVLFDDPSKAAGSGERGIAPRLRQVIASLKNELLIESAYFVPGTRGVDLLGQLEDRGVEVRILTNSLASNDVTPAFSGYAPYRLPLLRHGVELHELRADPGSVRQYWSNLATRAKATLHTKTLVFDRSKVFIGSMNLDPRSDRINTEIGLLIHSEELSTQVATFIELGMEPENSYVLSLNDKSGHSLGPMMWQGETRGTRVQYHDEPEASIGKKMRAWFLSLLPIEKQL